MEISIPKEVLSLHRLCAKATEDGTPGMSKMRLLFDKNTGRAQVSNGTLACEATWVDPEYGLESSEQVVLSGVDAKYLAGMAGSEEVIYSSEDQAFSCGSFTLPAGKPVQKDFAFMEETLNGALHGLQPKGVKGLRFDAKSFKMLVDLASKITTGIPLVFYGDNRPVCLEVEKGELAFKFLLMPRAN